MSYVLMLTLRIMTDQLLLVRLPWNLRFSITCLPQKLNTVKRARGDGACD